MFQVEKRDGTIAEFQMKKITDAIGKAFGAKDMQFSDDMLQMLALRVTADFQSKIKDGKISVEAIQDSVENVLIQCGYAEVAKAYILYRKQREKIRNMKSTIVDYKEIVDSYVKVEDWRVKENSTVTYSVGGLILSNSGAVTANYWLSEIYDEEIAEAHRNADIHIHDLDFYTLTTTCCQIDLLKLFRDGFSTGHGFLREPNDIRSYAALACIAIQSNQNDQHGGQSVPNFDYSMAPGVRKTFRKLFRSNLAKALEVFGEDDNNEVDARELTERVEQETGKWACLAGDNGYDEAMAKALSESMDEKTVAKCMKFARKYADKETRKGTYQAMEALVHNLNTMHSRAGAQIPFSSLNYGTDTSPEGRLVMEQLLLATEAGLGNGETPIFPIHIFKVKEGVNYNDGDPNYDLFKLACRVSAKRMFPNFSFLDAPFNLKYYKPGHPETEVGYMGCRTRVMSNIVDPSREITYGRGNLSFTSVNLPRIAIRSHGDLDWFFEDLDRKIDLVIDQLLDRFRIQCGKRVRNYPFLMGEGVWIDSEKLGPDDEVGEVLKHGTLTLGFIGLAECLKALIGSHHGESEEAQNLGLEIVGHMRKRMDEASEKYHLNFSLIATPAEGLSGRFVRIDREKYGVIPGVTDRDYYTNSFHVPVYYPISAFEKIAREAPYHELTNGGHISYIELDGDPTQNLEAFEAVVRAMKEAGIGYGAINHPIDRDPVCGYTGIIGEVCPRCGRREGEGVPLSRLQKLGLYKNYNSTTIGYHGDPNEEADRQPNTLKIVRK